MRPGTSRPRVDRHQAILGILEKRERRALPDGGGGSAVPKRVRAGVWVWIGLLGVDLAYELVAFADGSGGQPTLSQLVKGLVRAGGVAGVVGCVLLLFGAAVTLSLHWALGAF